MVDNQLVEAVSASLIREYLNRKGLKATLDSMDVEMPRTENSINNRVALMKQLHIEKIMKMNKGDRNPLRSMIEVITKFILEQPDFCSIVLEKSHSSSKSSQPCVASDKKVQESVHIEGKGMVNVSKHRSKTPIVGANGDCVQKKHGEASSLLKDSSNSQKQHRQEFSIKKRENSLVDNFKSVPNVKDEEGAIPIPMEASCPDTLFDEFFREGRNKESKFVSDFYQPPNKNMLVDSSAARLSYPTLLQEKVKESKKSHHVDHNSPENSFKTLNESGIHGRRSSSVETLKDINIEDVDDCDVSDFKIPPPRSSQMTGMCGLRKPMDLNTAMKLKTLILGSANSQFSPEWAKQSLEFCTLPKLQYGIVQKKGGPCGVLAAIQSYVLLEMLFGKDRVNTDPCFEPSPEDCRNALAAALSKIFWQAGGQKSAIVTLSSGTAHFIGGNKCKPDQLTETLILYQLTSYKELNSLLQKNIILFQSEGSSGLILAVYSVILSRTVKKIRSEMDEPNSKLMGSYGYCSQELVNLFVTGNAVSNVFDNLMELDPGSDNVTVLRGIQHPTDIGFLSLFEHYNNTKVGSYYKNPKYPIWIVCSESHFTVLFSMSAAILEDSNTKTFDLHYYDGLAQQQQPIRLTIDINNPHFKTNTSDDMLPPLDLCIRTKWHNAFVDWNTTEPLL